MRGKLHQAFSRRNFLKGSGTAAVAAAALPAGMVRSLPADAADASNPFPHGLASGDPESNRVMLWTRLNPEFVEANAQPGQAGIRSKPRCKGCKVESAPSTRTGKPGCKGCKVERDPSASAKVQSAGVVWEIVSFGEKLNPRNPLEMTDEQFDDGLLVASGNATATAIKDYTIKIDAAGLVEGTYYYYRFSHGGITSPIARTKTLPANPTTAKIALVSCSSIPHGYFNAYGALAGKGEGNDFDDVDVVLCLGDYVYEYAQYCYPAGEDVRGPGSEPPQEMVTLSEYRQRHRQYKLDQDLQALHRKFPMINVWDDHETTDNSYPFGGFNHQPGTPQNDGPTDPDADVAAWQAYHCNEPEGEEAGPQRKEGNWRDEGGQQGRLNAGKQAYFEYLPIRPGDKNSIPLYRKFSFGSLADLFMLDTRLNRQGPGCPPPDNQNPKTGAEACGMDDVDRINEPTRSLLGFDQEGFLETDLLASSATWQLLGQQIMVGQLRVLPNPAAELPPLATGVADELLNLFPGDNPLKSLVDAEGVIFLTDIWDGWQASRDRLYTLIEEKNAQGGNVVILTGDIHTSWANDIHPDPLDTSRYNLATGDGSLAIEFVCPSITSKGLPELACVQGMISSVNPHIQFLDLEQHGFVILDVDSEKVSSTWHFIGDIETSGASDVSAYNISSTKTFTSVKDSHFITERGEQITNIGNCEANPIPRPV